MFKRFDAISLGELVVEFFRKEVDIPFNRPGDLVGPYPSGAPAIFIDTMARLGAKCGFIGTVGMDDFADCIIARLKSDDVDTSHIVRIEGITTGTAFTAYFSGGERKFIYHMSNAAPGRFSPEHIDEEYVKSSSWLHISGNVLAFSDSAKEAILKAIDVASKYDIPISLDPNMRLEMMRKDEIEELLRPVLEKTTIFFPSEGEIGCVTGLDNEERGVLDLLKKGIKVIARKEGAYGCTIFTEDEKLHFKAFDDIVVVDPTGCGDSFSAAFVYGYSKGWDFTRTGLFANAVGSITATKKGSMEGIKSFEEVEQFLNQRINEGKYFNYM
jgi:sugar/nucleoside kinase (ribokinase family)